MDTVEVLEAARDLILDPKDWCGNGWGFGDEGRCALHALAFIEDLTPEHDEPSLICIGNLGERLSCKALEQQVGRVGEFNDTHTHAEVIDVFNKALANERAKRAAHTRHMNEEQERESVEDSAAPLVFA